MFPFLPQDARSFRKETASGLMLSLKNGSLEMVHPAENEGKYPHLACLESLDESKASARKLAWRL